MAVGDGAMVLARYGALAKLGQQQQGLSRYTKGGNMIRACGMEFLDFVGPSTHTGVHRACT